MAGAKRPRARIVGGQRADKEVARAGSAVLVARRRRKFSQGSLAKQIGVSRARLAAIEAGQGGGAPAEVWFALGEALGIYLKFEFGRDPQAELRDAGHLDIQELVLRAAKAAGWERAFEAKSGGWSSDRSVDVRLVDRKGRRVVVGECWNTRDPHQELEDGGHLEMQEFTLRLGRSTGFGRTFELATRPANPAFSVDVGLRDDARRLLVLEECWNTFGNIGASVRSTRRKIAEAEALAVVIGGERGPYRVAAVWVVRDTPRNRAVLARYPEVFESTFTGSSTAWVAALTVMGAPVPAELGLVWCDPRRGRLTGWRRAG